MDTIDFNLKFKEWLKSQEYKELKNKNKENKKIHNQFLKDYSLEKIGLLNKEDYVIGNAKQTFAKKVEFDLDFLGSIGGIPAYLNGVLYWNKRNNEYSFGPKKWKQRAGFGSDIDTVFESVKQHLYNLIANSQSKNYSGIDSNPLPVLFKNKISYIYDSKNQLPIYSNNDLIFILSILGIDFDFKDGVFSKRQKLFDFYFNKGYSKTVSTLEFCQFIYSKNNGLALYLPKIKSNAISNKNPSTINTDFTFEGDKKGPKVVNGIDETILKAIGSLGEKIVEDYLKVQLKKRLIKKYICYCKGESQNDSIGYDFLVVNKDNTKLFVEVKSSSDKSLDKVHFYLSKNEYDKMIKNTDRYVFYYVHDVYSSRKIRIIQSKDIKDRFKPCKYYI